MVGRTLARKRHGVLVIRDQKGRVKRKDFRRLFRRMFNRSDGAS